MTTIIYTEDGTFTAPDPYVPERVKAAFNELEGLGYAAEGNSGCCQSCVIGAFERDGIEWFVFYHSQSAEGLSEDGQVYLAWRGDAQEIIQVFEKHGLNPEWKGSEEHCILITVPEAKGVDPYVDESTWVPVPPEDAARLKKSLAAERVNQTPLKTATPPAR